MDLEFFRATRLSVRRPAAMADFGALFIDDDDARKDVTIVCGDREFKAHAVILRGRSEYFARILTGE